MSQTYTVTVSCPGLVDVLSKAIGPYASAANSLPVATTGANYTTTISETPAGGNPTFTIISAGQ